MAFDKLHQATKSADVDLIPVMNLFVVMIPFLLLSAAFLHVGVIPTTLPTQTDGASDIAADTQSVTINLHMAPEALHLSASNAVLEEEVLSELAATIPRKGEAHDLEALTDVLHGIKSRYPNSDTVILLPGEGVVYSDVVLVLDAAREKTIEAEGAESKNVPLFPVVVLSKKVEAS